MSKYTTHIDKWMTHKYTSITSPFEMKKPKPLLDSDSCALRARLFGAPIVSLGRPCTLCKDFKSKASVYPFALRAWLFESLSSA